MKNPPTASAKAQWFILFWCHKLVFKNITSFLFNHHPLEQQQQKYEKNNKRFIIDFCWTENVLLVEVFPIHVPFCCICTLMLCCCCCCCWLSMDINHWKLKAVFFISIYYFHCRFYSTQDIDKFIKIEIIHKT